MKNLKQIGIALLTALTISSCQKINDSQIQRGKIAVNMTDAPGDYEAFVVTVQSVDAYLNGEGWVNLNQSAQTFDVLSLTNGQELNLALNNNAQAGIYSQIKITFAPQASLTLHQRVEAGGFSSTGNQTVNATWNGPSEVIITVNQELEANGSIELLLDFNVAESIIETATSYVIDPLITLVSDTQTGVEGSVEGAVNAAVIISNEMGSFSTYINEEGEFLLQGIPEGLYDITVIPEADELGMVNEQHIENVLIVNGSIQSIGSIVIP